MLNPEPTTAFRNEIRRLAARGRDITKIFIPLFTLLNGLPLPRQYEDHPLKGVWSGHREFHIEPDWLIIYRVAGETLFLERTGSHSDLFKK